MPTNAAQSVDMGAGNDPHQHRPRTLPEGPERQTSKTDAHHCKSGRYGSLKESDRCTIPLCQDHHQGLRFDRDKTKLAYHQGQETWEAAYGPDHDYIAATLDAVEAMT